MHLFIYICIYRNKHIYTSIYDYICIYHLYDKDREMHVRVIRNMTVQNCMVHSLQIMFYKYLF